MSRTAIPPAKLREYIKTAMTVFVVTALLGGCYLQRGGWMMISPKYDEKKLLGLTRDEVVQRLGPPSFDPQTSTTRPWNEAEEGPYYLGYFQGWATCRIGFKDGRVDSVDRFWK